MLLERKCLPTRSGHPSGNKCSYVGVIVEPICCAKGNAVDGARQGKADRTRGRVGVAIDNLVARAAEAGGVIWAGAAVQQLRAQLPNTEMSPAELAEAIIRSAAARGLPVAVQRAE